MHLTQKAAYKSGFLLKLFNLILVFGLFDALIHILHFFVDFGDAVGTFAHFFVNSARQFCGVGFIAYVVFEACPEVHCYSADLHLDHNVFGAVGKVNGNPQIEVKRTITVIIGFLI